MVTPRASFVVVVTFVVVVVVIILILTTAITCTVVAVVAAAVAAAALLRSFRRVLEYLLQLVPRHRTVEDPLSLLQGRLAAFLCGFCRCLLLLRPQRVGRNVPVATGTSKSSQAALRWWLEQNVGIKHHWALGWNRKAGMHQRLSKG
jgi:hypothetical protein